MTNTPDDTDPGRLSEENGQPPAPGSPPGYGPPPGSDPSGYWPAPPGYPPPGYGPPGYGPPGYGPPGYGPPGYGPPGYGPPGYGPPGYGPPGYGPPPAGYGPPGYGAAPPWFQPAPKPGIIPLRPLDLGEILAGAVGYIRDNPLVTLGLAAIVLTLSQVVQVASQGLLVTGTAAPRSARDVPGYVLGALGGSAIATVITFVAFVILSGMLIVVLSRSVLGWRTTLREAWSAVASRLPGLLGLSLLTGLIIGGIVAIGVVPLIVAGLATNGAPLAIVIGVLVLLAAFVLAVYIGVLLVMATPAYVLEDIGVIAALTRSRELVRETWWRVFGILLLAGVLTVVITFVISIPFTIGAGVSSVGRGPTLTALILTGIGAVIAGTLTTPFSAGVTCLLYIDQRIRREGFADELARSAAVRGG